MSKRPATKLVCLCRQLSRYNALFCNQSVAYQKEQDHNKLRKSLIDEPIYPSNNGYCEPAFNFRGNIFMVPNPPTKDLESGLSSLLWNK